MGASSPQYQPESLLTARPVAPPPPAPSGERAAAAAPFVLLDQLPGAVLLLDAAGRVVQLNGIAELRLDVVRSEAIGRDLFRELLPALEAEGAGEQYRSAMLAGQAALACEVSFERPTGPRRVSVGIRSYVGEGALGAVALLEDRTALATEMARRRRAEELAAVGELATGVAHEINNPLASIKGFAQLLARDATTETQTQALEIISQECSRVAKIIDRLLDFSTQQRSRGRDALNLSALVDGLLELRQYALETAGIELERDLSPSLSLVRGERGALQRLILSLLHHAELSLRSQEPGRRVTVRTRESTDGVVLYVIDNGAGLPRERLRTLFSGPGEEGTEGMSLMAALEIARSHGGHLWADSVQGEGTAFFLRLPRLEEEPQPAAPSAPSSAAALMAAPAEAAAPRPLRVLVADDEATLRLAISLFLVRQGHEVVQAADAYEAHRLALEEPFDAVLADARMPGDGIQLLDKLDALPGLKGRTILMTGDQFAMAGDGVAARRPQLTKPFDLTEVLRLIEALGR